MATTSAWGLFVFGSSFSVSPVASVAIESASNTCPNSFLMKVLFNYKVVQYETTHTIGLCIYTPT